MKNLKLLSFAVIAFLLCTITLASCGGGGLPNGRYTPVDETLGTTVLQAIIINGDNFTTVLPMIGTGITMKYKYTNGTLTFTGTEGSAGLPCVFRNDTLFYGGMPFLKAN